MPPVLFIPRKRRHSSPAKDASAPKPVRRKSLFETLDNAGASSTLEDNRSFIDDLNDGDTESSLSDVSTFGREDLHMSKRRRAS